MRRSTCDDPEKEEQSTDEMKEVMSWAGSVVDFEERRRQALRMRRRRSRALEPWRGDGYEFADRGNLLRFAGVGASSCAFGRIGRACVMNCGGAVRSLDGGLARGRAGRGGVSGFGWS